MLFNQISHFQKLARKNFEDFGELAPVMFGVYKDPETGEYIQKIIGLVFGPEDKDAFTNFLCNEIRNNNLKEYLLVLESWITEFNIEGIPKKSECVMMVYSSAKQEKVCMSSISRSPDRLGEWKDYNAKNMQGRFLGLYKKAVAEWN